MKNPFKNMTLNQAEKASMNYATMLDSGVISPENMLKQFDQLLTRLTILECDTIGEDHHHLVPKEVADLIDSYHDGSNLSFTEADKLNLELNKFGWSIDIEMGGELISLMKIIDVYEYTVSTNTIWASFDFGEVVASTLEEATKKAIEELTYDFDKANEALAYCGITEGFKIEFAASEVRVSLKEKLN